MTEKNNNTAQPTRQREQIALVGVVVGVVAIFAVVLLVALGQQNAATPTSLESKRPYEELRHELSPEGFPIMGDPEAKIMLVEWANFSCPACAQYATQVDEMIDRFVRNGEARIMYMPMVFDFGTDPSFISAQGALCAAKQGGFWEMHDALFTIHRTQGPRAFSPTLMRDVANSLKLDGEAVYQCVQTGQTAIVVQKAIELGGVVAIQYTPTLQYSMDGGKTFEWFTDNTGQRYDARVPIDDVARTVARVYGK